MKKKKLLNRLLSALLAVIMTIGLIPMGSVTVKAETKNATLSNLGALGTVKIGSKSESGTWYQTEVAGTPVFCLDLGKACHAGDVYVSSDATYSSDSKNEKKALEAKIGYWYSVTKNESTKSCIYAQSLMWACEEGETSEKKLTDVISQVRKNTGYYDSKSAAELYAEIFKISATVSCKIKMWKYGGSGSYRQVLLEIVGTPILPVYEKINDTLVYRQRITIDKTDEDGNPVSQVPFEVTAQNYKELYDYKVNGWGDAETGDADGESVFTSIAETDAKGRITYKFNYQIQSKNYGYVKASDLGSMTADDKKDIKNKMDDKNINYASDLTKAGAEKLMKADLDAQMKKISNQYAVKEVGAGSDDMLVNSEYANGKIITIESAGSWTKVNGSWPETADKTYADYGKATKLGIVNKYKKATIVVNKKVENTSDNTAHGDTSVDGSVYRMYTDAACTNPVTTVYDANGNAKAASDYTIKNGTLETDYIRTKDTVYIKEIKHRKDSSLIQQFIRLRWMVQSSMLNKSQMQLLRILTKVRKRDSLKCTRCHLTVLQDLQILKREQSSKFILDQMEAMTSARMTSIQHLQLIKREVQRLHQLWLMVRTCFIRQRQVQRTLKRLMTKSLKLVRTSQVRDLITKHIHISITTNHLRHT